MHTGLPQDYKAGFLKVVQLVYSSPPAEVSLHQDGMRPLRTPPSLKATFGWRWIPKRLKQNRLPFLRIASDLFSFCKFFWDFFLKQFRVNLCSENHGLDTAGAAVSLRNIMWECGRSGVEIALFFWSLHQLCCCTLLRPALCSLLHGADGKAKCSYKIKGCEMPRPTSALYVCFFTQSLQFGA